MTALVDRAALAGCRADVVAADSGAGVETAVTSSEVESARRNAAFGVETRRLAELAQASEAVSTDNLQLRTEFAAARISIGDSERLRADLARLGAEATAAVSREGLLNHLLAAAGAGMQRMVPYAEILTGLDAAWDGLGESVRQATQSWLQSNIN